MRIGLFIYRYIFSFKQMAAPHAKYATLNDINPARNDWKIKVRVSRIWKVVNTHQNDELISLDMVLIDEKVSFYIKAQTEFQYFMHTNLLSYWLSFCSTLQENWIHATIPKKFIAKNRELIEEGKVYKIQNFIITDNKKKYKIVENEYMLQFNDETEIERVYENLPNIITNKFKFVSFEAVNGRLDNEVLTGIKLMSYLPLYF